MGNLLCYAIKKTSINVTGIFAHRGIRLNNYTTITSIIISYALQVVMGTGLQRSLNCPEHCNGKAADSRLLTPTALTSGPDGSLYVGDFNFVRRITPEGAVTTVLQLEYV